jgi:hypothetical protein
MFVSSDPRLIASLQITSYREILERRNGGPEQFGEPAKSGAGQPIITFPPGSKL